jgi:hypothetical protein
VGSTDVLAAAGVVVAGRAGRATRPAAPEHATSAAATGATRAAPRDRRVGAVGDELADDTANLLADLELGLGDW